MKKFTTGFKAALAGLKETLIKEQNFKIMLAIAALVVFMMFYLPTAKLEKVGLLVAVFSVLTIELINSTLERVIDFLHPQQDERIRIIKDLSAAIVLFASIGAAFIGIIVFWPYLF